MEFSSRISQIQISDRSSSDFRSLKSYYKLYATHNFVSPVLAVGLHTYIFCLVWSKTFSLFAAEQQQQRTFNWSKESAFISQIAPQSICRSSQSTFKLLWQVFPCIKQRKHTEKCSINSSQVHAKAHTVTAGDEAVPPARLDHINPLTPPHGPSAQYYQFPQHEPRFKGQIQTICVWVCDTVCSYVCVCACVSPGLAVKPLKRNMSHCSTLQLIHSPPELSSALVFNWSQFWPQLPLNPLHPTPTDCHDQTLWSLVCFLWVLPTLCYVILVAAFSFSCYFSCCAWFSLLAAITLFSFCLATGQVLSSYLSSLPLSLSQHFPGHCSCVEKLLLQHHFSGYKRNGCYNFNHQTCYACKACGNFHCQRVETI